MKGAGDRYTIVFNGEIYNFCELRSALVQRGVVFRGKSDTEVLLHLYQLHGAEMLGRLNGIFAFAIWDAQEKTLFLARDALGVKPLYFAASTSGFAFASEIKALLAIMPIHKELDMVALHRYLSFLWCPGESTPIKGVKKLGPGEAMLVANGKIIRRWTWYQLPVFSPPVAGLSLRASLEGTVEHMRSAVHRQMVSDVPVGAFLSGGLDSSSVVAFAREVSPDIRCFSIEAHGGVEDGAVDDLPYAKTVAKHLGVPLDIVTIDSGQMAQNLEWMVRQLDEPLADPACLNVYYISQLARQNGIKVLLSGAGGDDIFTGYRRHLAVRMERYWAWAPLRVRRHLAQIGKSLGSRNAKMRRMSKQLGAVALNGDERLLNYYHWIDEQELNSIYTPEFISALDGQKAAAPMAKFLGQLPPEREPLERMLALEQRFFLTDHNLNYTDKMSMAAGVEARVPFLDPDLMRFSNEIPMRYKQKGRQGKWVLKKAMEPFLPKEVIYRPKTGFGAPLRRWMSNDLRELAGDLLSDASLARRGIFNVAAVNQLRMANSKGLIDANYSLFSMLCIELWCREFIDTVAA
jgi:asparagine synthase (glutamine-hydrolysing)